MKKVLLVGGGGREYALARKIAESPLVEIVYRAPGNGGVIDKTVCVDIKASEVAELVDFAIRKDVNMAVIGPEDPLADSIVDLFELVGIPVIGPTLRAAQLESSKIFTRRLLDEIMIPSASFYEFDDTGLAQSFIDNTHCLPCVIKVDGLAAGKGAMVCRNMDDVMVALKRIDDNEFGCAAKRFLVEEFLVGEEASCILLIDKKGHILPLAGSQDHKAVYAGDEGPNTGGMGAYSPAPVLDQAVEKRTLTRIARPLIEGMRLRHTPFYGFLYVGLMIDSGGNPSVVEFNVRLGDPETQPILARMETDIVELFDAYLAGTLDTFKIKWKDQVAVSVVMAEDGYPGEYSKGHVISGIKEAEATGAIVDLAGVSCDKDGQLLTNGGRVLCVTGLGYDHESAIVKAYQAVKMISWGTEYYRPDIGHKALHRN